MRLFTGIPLPKDFKKELVKMRFNNQHLEGVRWTKEQNMHITTCFIGNTPEALLEGNIEKIKSAVANTKKFSLNLKNISFSPGKKPYMIWANFDQNDAFSALSVAINEALGLKIPSRKSPIPHITLARFKKSHYYYKPEFNIPVNTTELDVTSVTLWKSVTHSSGAEYKPLEEFHMA